MSFSKVVLLGRLVRDPELRYTQNETALCKGTIATDAGWGERKKPVYTDFVMWGKRAPKLEEHFAKGDPILLEGELQMEEWDDKNTGAKRRKHILEVRDWSFVPRTSPDPGQGQQRPEAKQEPETFLDDPFTQSATDVPF